MTERKFQAGDRVWCERDKGWRGIAGTVMVYDGEWMKFSPDEGQRYASGLIVSSEYRKAPRYAGMDEDDFDLVVSAADELAELRAFKETALASGYVPPEPVDSDDTKAREMAIDLCERSALFSNASDLRNCVEQASSSGALAMRSIREAIAWARANPR